MPTSITRLAELKDVPLGSAIIVTTSKGREIALFNVEGEIYALDNACPHMGGPLGQGCLEGYHVTCPWHGWEFDVRDGACSNMPGEDAKKLPLHIEDGTIYLKE